MVPRMTTSPDDPVNDAHPPAAPSPSALAQANHSPTSVVNRPTMQHVPPPEPAGPQHPTRVGPLGSGFASAPAPAVEQAPAADPVADPAADAVPVATATSASGDALRGRVLAAIKDAVAAARAAATKAAIDPAEAVHEVRKALRRMRAIVDAVAPTLARDAHKSVRKALIEARRTLGPARDRTVAHLALGELPSALADHARALIAASAEQAPQLDAELDALTRAVAEADAQAVALAAALPDQLAPGRIARGLSRTYAGARRARRKARR